MAKDTSLYVQKKIPTYQEYAQRRAAGETHDQILQQTIQEREAYHQSLPYAYLQGDDWSSYVRQRQAQQQRREEVAGQINRFNSYFSVHGLGTNSGSPFARFAPGAQAARTQTDTSGVMDFKALDEKARAAQKEQRRVDREKAQRDYEEALQAYNKARENTRRVSSVAGSVGPETRHRIDEARREETAAKERMDGLKQALDGLPSEENGITQWEGREELVKEYQRIQRLMGSAVGRDNPASLARYQKYGEQLEEVRQKIEEGDRAAWNSPSDYSGADRFGSVLGSWGKSIAGGAMNALLTAADMAGKGYAQGYDTNRVLLDWMQGADSMEQWRQQAKGYESQENRDFWGKLYAAADSISDSAAADLDRAKNGLGRLGQAGLDIAKNVMEVGFDAGISAMTGIPALGVMATRVFGDSARDARRQGATLEQQVGYAAASAGIEVLTEIFADGLAGIYGKGAADNISETVIRRLSNTEAGATFLRILMGMNSEGLEEVASDLLHPFAERIYNADVFKDGYLANIDPAEMLYDYLLGGAVGALFGGAGAVTGESAARNAQNDYITALYEQRGEKPGFFREVRDRAILERQAEEPGAYRTESMSAGENAQEVMQALRGRQTESQRAQELQQTQKAMASEGMGEMIRAVFSDDGVTLSDGEVKTLTEKAAEGKAGIRETVWGYREAYRMGENGDTWEDVVESVGKRYGLTPSQITYAWGYGRNTQTTESGTADISTEEGRTKAESRLAIFGERAQEALELMQPRQDVGRYASALNKAAYLYAANGVDVQQMAEQARSGKAADIVGYLTAEQAALAQKIGEEQRQQVRKSVKAMSEARATMRQQAAALTQGQTVTAAALEQVDSALADARARAQEARKVYADNMAKLDAMQRLSPKEWETEAFQTAYNEAVDKASAAKEAIQQTEAEIRELSKKKAEAEGKKVIQRKKGTVSFGGGTVEGRRFEGVERDKLSRQQKKVVAMVESLADTINLDYVFFNGEAGTGGAYVQGGTVFVNVNAGLGVGGFSQTMAAASLSHELTHWLQDYEPEVYQKLKDFVISEVLKAGPQKLNELVKQQRKWEADRNLSYDEALDEVVANACQTMLLDSKAITELARQHMSTAQKIADYISEWTQKVKDAFAEVDTSQGAIYDSLRAVQGGLDRMQELWDEGIRAASANYDAEQIVEDNNVPGKTNAEANENAAPEGGVQYQAWEQEEILHLKEQINNRQEDLQRMTPVATLTSEIQFDRDNVYAAVEWVKDKLGLPRRVNREGFGTVLLDRKRINRGFNYRPSARNAEIENRLGQAYTTACVAIPNVIEHGIEIEHHKNHKGRGYPTWTYAAPVVIDGERGNLAVVVKRTTDNYYDVHSILTPNGNLLVLDRNNKAEASDGGASRIKEDVAPSMLSAESSIPDSAPERKAQYQRWDNTDGDTAAEANGREDAYTRIEAENKAVADMVTALQKLTKKQQSTIDKLQKRLKLTKTPEVRTADANRMARQLVKEYGARVDVSGISEQLKELGDYILQAKDLDENEVRSRARAIAAEIVDNAVEQISMEDETISAIAGSIKGRKFTISPDFLGELDQDGGFDAFRKRNFGSFTLARADSESIDRSEYTSVAQAYADLQSEYGKGYFPDVANEGEEIRNIAAAVQAAVPMEVNPFEQYRGEAVEQLANQIAVDSMSGALRPTSPTDADRAKSTRDALKAQVKQLQKEGKIQEREAKDYERTIDELTGELDKAERRYRSLKITGERRLSQVRAEGRARQEEIKAKDRKRLERKSKALQKYYQDMISAARERRNEAAGAGRYRKQIEKKAAKLYEMLAKNDDKTHVPEVLKEPLGEFLETLDFSSKRKLNGGVDTQKDKAFGARLLQIQQILSRQQDYINGGEMQQDLGGYIDVSDDNMQYLRNTAEKITTELSQGRDFTINKMNAADLRDLSNFLSNLTSAIRKMNEFMANARFQSVREAASQDIEHVKGLGKASEFDTGKLMSAAAWESGTPYYVFRRFGEGGKAIFDSLTRGWEKMAFNMKELLDFTEGTYTEKEAREWQKQIHDIELEDGRNVTMTTGQIMSFSMLLGREQAIKHMEKGGVRIGDIETKKGVRQDITHYHLTEKDIESITGKLTARQLEVAQKLQRFMARRGSEWGNEISMRRFGYNFYTEGDSYFPIKTDSTDRPMSDTDAQQNSMFRLLNLSASKSLNPKASNALVVNDIFDVFTDHMSDMAKLNGMGLPILDAIKWFNFKDRVDLSDGQYDTRTMQGTLQQAFGDKALNYFRTFIKDINGVTENGDRGTGLTSRFLRNYKTAAVAANLRVAFLQPTSYVRASYLIKPKYLLQAFTNHNAYKEALANSGTAVWKSMGFYDTNVARGMRDQIKHNETWKDKLVEKSMSLAEFGDNRTWGRLWVACKLQAQAETGKTGDALIQETKELFRQVIYSSQVMDSTLTRSELMRGNTLRSRAMTAFMAEPTLSYNMVMDAAFETNMNVRRYGREEGLKRSAGYIGKALAVYVCSATFSAIIESIADAFRDDDEYENFLQKWAQAMFGEGNIFSGNLAQDLTIIGKLPYFKEFMSTLRGYQSGDMSLAAFNNAINAFKIWKETLDLQRGVLEKPTKLTYYGNMTTWGKIYKSLQALSQLTGLPVANLTRDVLAVWNTVADGMLQKPEWKIKTYDPGPKKAIQTAVERGYMSTEEAERELLEKGLVKDADDAYWTARSFEGEDKYTQIKAAALNGENGVFRHEMEQLTGHGVSEKDARSEVKSFIKKAYTGGELTKAESKLLGDKTLTAEAAQDILVKYTGMGENDAYLTVKGWESGDSGKYTGALRAAFNGDQSAFKRELADLTSHGVKQKDVEGQVESFARDLYFGNELSEEQQEFAGGKSLTDAEARKMLHDYAGMSVNKAVETVAEWVKDKKFLEKNGWLYSKRKSLYVDGDITKQQLRKALMDYGGLSAEKADATIKEYEYDRDTGYLWSERKEDFQRGDISRNNMINYLMKYGGKNRKGAEEIVTVWEWQKNVNGAESITASAINDYNTYCAKTGVSKEVFVQAWTAYNDTKADLDAKGETIKNSKTKKVMLQINNQRISAAQKEAIALCFYSQSTVNKYRLW